MRSLKELSYRLRQEAANAILYAFPPLQQNLSATSPLALFPPPGAVAEAIHRTSYEAELVRLADRILQDKVPMLGSEVEYGPAIGWRRDPLSGKETPRDYFRFIPYLDAQVAGDHKVIWEINRHQHLVLLAQAFVTTGNLAYSETVFRQSSAALGNLFPVLTMSRRAFLANLSASPRATCGRTQGLARVVKHVLHAPKYWATPCRHGKDGGA